MKYLLLLVSLVFSVSSFAGEIAKGEVREVVNVLGGKKAFAVRLKPSATGVCADVWIEINQANFNDNLESYKFAFGLVNTALVADKTIRIHNYTNDACDGATFVGLYND